MVTSLVTVSSLSNNLEHPPEKSHSGSSFGLRRANEQQTGWSLSELSVLLLVKCQSYYPTCSWRRMVHSGIITASSSTGGHTAAQGWNQRGCRCTPGSPVTTFGSQVAQAQKNGCVCIADLLLTGDCWTDGQERETPGSSGRHETRRENNSMYSWTYRDTLCPHLSITGRKGPCRWFGKL